MFDPTNRLRCRITSWGPNIAIKPTSAPSKAVARALATPGDLINGFLADFDENLHPGKKGKLGKPPAGGAANP